MRRATGIPETAFVSCDPHLHNVIQPELNGLRYYSFSDIDGREAPLWNGTTEVCMTFLSIFSLISLVAMYNFGTAAAGGRPRPPHPLLALRRGRRLPPAPGPGLFIFHHVRMRTTHALLIYLGMRGVGKLVPFFG